MNKNWLKYLVAISAIMIAGSAAYFSVTGLGVLFSGAAVAVMIMAGSLEFAKLVTATYLKQEWDNIEGINKWYLTSSVVILMLITSAGIFGYLSNAFQQQNLKLEQVQREIDVWNNKIKTDTTQITLYTNQLNQLQSNNNTVLNNNTNRNSLRFATSTSKEQSKIRTKISVLNDSVVAYNGQINDIKNKNINLEKEVGGFRFVAESFNVPLNSVVKFFIILIVIVFDPLAVALVISFNQLVLAKKPEEDEDITPKSNPEDLKNFVDESARIRLSENDLKKLEEVLLNPPPPNENLKMAAKVYDEKVVEKTLEQLENYFKNTPQEEIQKHIDEINNMDVDTQISNQDVTLEDGLEEEFDEDWGELTNEELIGDDEIVSTIEPTEEEESRNFSTIEPISENIFYEDEEINIPVDEAIDNEPEFVLDDNQVVDDNWTPQLEEEFWSEQVPEPFATPEELESEQIPPNEIVELLDEVQTETFSDEPITINEIPVQSEPEDEKKILNRGERRIPRGKLPLKSGRYDLFTYGGNHGRKLY